MAIAADFERVYEIGPVFRAENSFTNRHLTEFMGLDLEMVIEEHYHEVMELLDKLFLFIFRSLKQKFSKEIETVGAQFPCEEFKWRDGPEGTLKFTYSQAVDLLVEDGVDRSEVGDDMEFVKFNLLDFILSLTFTFSSAPRTRRDSAESSRRNTTPITILSTNSQLRFAPFTPCRTRATR